MKGKTLLWLKGCVRIQILGKDCERFLNLCAYHKIVFWNLIVVPGGYEGSLSRQNFKKIKTLVKKCHIKVKITKKTGVPFFLFHYRKRKTLLISLLAAFFFVVFLSFFIWDIEIQGNLSVTDEKVMDYLQSQGIHQGILKSEMDYKQLASQLRQYFSEITWVSVKLQGTRLLISLKENEDRSLETEDSAKPGNIVSDVDGIVVSIVTRAGSPRVTAGTEVKKGDLLVSGVVELINDANEIYDYQMVPADADIYIQTRREYEDVISLKQEKKVYTGDYRWRNLLQFGSFRIGIPFFKIPFTTYDIVTETKQFRVMDNFYLPIYYSDIQIREYYRKEIIYTWQQAEEQLNANLQRFLEKIEQKGVQIFENNVKIEKTVSLCRAKGNISFIEKAGIRADIELEQQQEGTLTE